LRVANGTNAASRLLARLLRFPGPGDAVDTTLLVTRNADGSERWQRTFDGRQFDSRQHPDGHGGFTERFGATEFTFRTDAVGKGVVYTHTATALAAGPIRIPLPRACTPRITAREDVVGPRQRRVNVCVDVPILGVLLTYGGTIDLDDETSERSERDHANGAQREAQARERVGESEGQRPSDRK
jgi:hypothetical protein